MRKVYNIANEWLHSMLPKVIADAVAGGLQQGGDYWGFLPGRAVRPGDTGPGAPGIPTEVGSSYPWGIGLPSALEAIIQGGYVSGNRFSSGHKGLDIASRTSDAIRAIIGGTVLQSGYNPALEGQYIITQDPAGRGAYYGHMVPGSQLFARGDLIGRGSTIGTMGSSGEAYGKHIHFELRVNGASVNPEGVFAGTTPWPLGPDIVTITAPTQLPSVPQGARFLAGTPTAAQQWIVAAARAAGVGDDWLYGMSVVGRYESGFSPTAIAFSRDDYNAIRNQHSRGIAQTIPTTFNDWRVPGARAYQPPWGHVPQYGPGGYDTSPDVGDIYDPIHNFAASIRYIAARYGHVNRLPGVASVARGEGWIGYASGGIITEPIVGIGLQSGQKYSFGEHAFNGRGQEIVIPLDDSMDRRNTRMLAGAMNSRGSSSVSNSREDHWNVVVHQHEIQSERSIRDEIWTLRHLDPRG
jgi:SLT domain-containing protein